MVHHIMKPLKGVPLDDIKSFIQSQEMREQHDNLVDEFYTIFKTINKDDDSLDTAIALQGYGFNLRRFEEDKDEENKKPYAFASKLCTEKLPFYLVDHLAEFLQVVESLTKEDVALFMSAKGVLFQPGAAVVQQTRR